jgi:CheY-specific phosphatase CheX
MKTPRRKIGIAQNICHENGAPTMVRITKKTMSVGMNLKIAITEAEIGNIIRGNAVFIIKRCPEVIDLTPPVKLFAMR